MLGGKEYFRGGRLDRDALVGFIKEIKKNTKLSDEDAAVMAASKVGNLLLKNYHIDLCLNTCANDNKFT